MKEYDDYEIWKKVTRSIKSYSNNKASSNIENKLLDKKKIKVNLTSTIKTTHNNIIDSRNKKESVNKNTLIADLRDKDNIRTGIDKSTLKKIKKGSFQIDNSLDLHGSKLIEAEIKVKNFIRESFKKQQSFLLIITGKGFQGEGKIKRNISLWLNCLEFSKIILAFSNADKKDGGEGAIYVKLRRNKINQDLDT